jgi:pyridoxal phosphate enzyme (YggS family)
MLENALQHIEQNIQSACGRSGRERSDVQLVAVTKTVDTSLINEAISAGCSDIGENRVQEYLEKRPGLMKHRFHMIGALQRNKVRQIIEFVDLIHSVDTIKLAVEIDRQAAVCGRIVDCLVEVNTSGELSKHGFQPESVPGAVAEMAGLKNRRIRGLMTIGSLDPDPGRTRQCFRSLRQIRERLRGLLPQLDFRHLSMGMSSDYMDAIEEGATIVRIGSALFGARNK